MRNYSIAGMLGLALLGLASPKASAFFHDCRRGCGCCDTVLCIRQYNAFSPICSGCVTCCGCVPFCGGCQPPCYPPPYYGGCGYGGADCYHGGCAPSTAMTLPPVNPPPSATATTPAPSYVPTSQPMPAGPAAMTGMPYYPPMQPAGYMGYGYPQQRPMPYGYPGMAPMMR